MRKEHLTAARANSMCREMQLFLLGYIIISICEIFSVGVFPLNDTVRVVSRCALKEAFYSIDIG
jgi:hypothetical protein